MSESLAVGRAPAARAPARPDAGTPALDPRRKLQLALGVIWVLDGILQYQPSMFTTGFPAMLAVGDQVPDGQVWLAPREPVGLHEVFESGPVLLLFYLFDWSGT